MWFDVIEKSWIDDLIDHMREKMIEAWDEAWFRKMAEHGLTAEDLEAEKEKEDIWLPEELYWKWLKDKSYAA